jgi:Zn-dependent protease with chaperone function
MKSSTCQRDQSLRPTVQRLPLREEGQSMLEMTVGVIFLLIIVLILFEMAMLFYSYIAVLNASREGAVYASAYPDMNGTQYQRYENITTAEAQAAGLNTDPAFFVVDAPETPNGNEPLQPIIVRVHYQLINPTQGILLPVMGRMGLFQSAWMTGETKMPIRR